MSGKRLRRLRRKAYEQQNHLCFYCAYPIWEEDRNAFSRLHGVSPRLAQHLKCTAEHLTARQDQGRDTASNVVAACLWCNRMRHQGRRHGAPDAVNYLFWVARLVAMDRWHPLAQSKRIAGSGERRAWRD